MAINENKLYVVYLSLSSDRCLLPKRCGLGIEVLGRRVAIYQISAEEGGRCAGSTVTGKWIL